MTDKPDLDISIGTSLQRLARQMAAVESRMNSTAKKQEKAFEATNKKIAQQFDRLQREANASLAKIKLPAGTNIGGLGGFGAGLAGVLSTREIIQYSDAWTIAGNKIAAASEIAGRQARSLSAINDIATETRSGLTETADLYAKLMRATAGVAESEEDVARATEIVNKAFKAGGAAASEQSAGILQLGQALGSGILQGDELRSLRENAPIIAQAIADEFGTTIAGLKELGAEGKLTSDRVFRAILNAQKPIEAAFSKTNATIGDSFQNLRNAVTEYIGDANKSAEASEKVAAAMEVLAGNLDALVALGGVMLARVIGPATVVMLGRLSAAFTGAAATMRAAGGAAGAAAVAVGGLRAALALVGGPVGLVITALAALPAFTTSSADRVEDLRSAGQEAATALNTFAEASKRAKEEQGGLAGEVSRATANILNQSRASLQASKAELEKKIAASRGDLEDGVVLSGQIGQLLSTIGPAESGSQFNRYLSALAPQLRAIRDGAGDVATVSREMERLAGVGSEVSELIAEIDAGLAKGMDTRALREANSELVKQAELIGGFEKELTALKTAASGEAQVRAFKALRDAMADAAQAGEVLRREATGTDKSLMANLRTLSMTEAALTAVKEALKGNWEEGQRLMAMANPFGVIQQGAVAAKSEVLSLKEAMEALPKEISSTITGLEGVSSGLEAATKLLHKFEGFRATPYDDGKRDGEGRRVGAPVWRAGWGSNTITLADGSIREISQGLRVSVEDANRDLERRLTNEFLPAARNAVGAQNFDTLTPAQQGVLGSLSYNYGAGAWSGALKPVADAVRAGSADGVAEAIYALGGHNGGINKDRRAAEASIFAKGVGFDGSIRRGEETEKELADKAKKRADEAARLADAAKDLSEALASDLLTTQETARLEKTRAETIQQINASSLSAPEKAAAIAEANGEYERQVAIMSLLADAKRREVDVNALVDESQQKVLAGLLGLKEGTITYAQVIDKLGEGYKAKTIAEQQNAAATENLKQQQEFAAQQTQALKDGLVDAIVEGKNFSDVLSNVAKSLAKAALQAALFGEGPMAKGGGGLLGGLFSMFGGGGVRVAGNDALSGALRGAIGFRANGGPVSAGQPYVVGERRPELFVPNVSGRIIPRLPSLPDIASQRASAGAAPTITFAPTIQANGAVSQTDLDMAQRRMAQFMEDNFIPALRRHMPNFNARYA